MKQILIHNKFYNRQRLIVNVKKYNKTNKHAIELKPFVRTTLINIKLQILVNCNNTILSVPITKTHSI